MTSKLVIYNNSLVDYIRDVKPYHTKLSDIIQEFRFSETVNVSVKDNHSISVTLSSIWNTQYFSDGYRTRYILPSFLMPRYSTDSAMSYETSHELNYLRNNFGLKRAYPLNASQGIESLQLDGFNKIEGIDFYLSKGMFSFNIQRDDFGHTTWTKTNSPDVLSIGNIHYNNFSSNPYMSISDILVNDAFESIFRIVVDQTYPNILFSVFDDYTGTLLGSGENDSYFYSSHLSFKANFSNTVEVGDTSYVRPQNRIAISPLANPSETWSIIKINPIVFPIVNGDVQGISHNIVRTKKVDLILFSPAMIESQAETWTFVYSESLKAFKVSGSKSGNLFDPIKLGPWYDNGSIRVKFVLTPALFSNGLAEFREDYIGDPSYIDSYNELALAQGAVVDGDAFYFTIAEKKPSLLVYGSVSKRFEYATIGDYFWNGKIGFMPSKPYYSINQTSILTAEESPLNAYSTEGYGDYFETECYQSVTGQNVVNSDQTWFLADTFPIQWNLVEGIVTNDHPDNFLALRLYSPPRFDAVDEQFSFSYVSPSSSSFPIPERQFKVFSDLRGQLPAAQMGYDYSNFESSVISLTYGNAGALNVAILDNGYIVTEETGFQINIVSNSFKPFHSENVLIVRQPSYNQITVKTFNYDKLELSISAPHPELGKGLLDPTYIPTFVKPNVRTTNFLHNYDYEGYGENYEEIASYGSPLWSNAQPNMPSRFPSYDLLLNNSYLESIGTISYQQDTSSGQYFTVIDFKTDFLTQYLPFNTHFELKALQTDDYNTLTSAIITEQLLFRETQRLHDNVTVKVTEGHNGFDIDAYDYYYLDPNTNIYYEGSYDSDQIEPLQINVTKQDDEHQTISSITESLTILCNIIGAINYSNIFDTLVVTNGFLIDGFIEYGYDSDYTTYDYAFGSSGFVGYDEVAYVYAYEVVDNATDQTLVIDGLNTPCFFRTYTQNIGQVVYMIADPNKELIVCRYLADPRATSLVYEQSSYVRVASDGVEHEPTGLPTIDGVTLQPGDRVLLKDSTYTPLNGIWIASQFQWTRATDSLAIGSMFFVEDGTMNGHSAWVVTPTNQFVENEVAQYTTKISQNKLTINLIKPIHATNPHYTLGPQPISVILY